MDWTRFPSKNCLSRPVLKIRPPSGGSGSRCGRIHAAELSTGASDAQASSIDLLRDVELNVKIELGRARMLG